MILRVLVALSFACSTFIYGALEDHLRPAAGKTGGHSMSNIDFIYTINLDERPEKFAHCLNELAPYGITPYRFSAVNGWKLTLEEIDMLGVEYASWMKTNLMGTYYPVDGDGSPVHEKISVLGRRYFCHCLSRGAIGILLSHLSILQDAYDSGYETIWVMEDDIKVLRNPHAISGLIERLDKITGKKGWDILFTDRDTKGQNGQYIPCRGYAQRPNFNPENPGRFALEPVPVSREFCKINARYGAYSMIVRRAGMKKILDFIKTYSFFLPYDMEFYLPSNISMYAVRQDVVSTLPNAFSDNGGPNYQESKDSDRELTYNTHHLEE